MVNLTQQENAHGPWVGATAVLLVILMGSSMFYYQYLALPATLGPTHQPQNIVIRLVAEQWAFKINGTIDTRTTPIVVHVGDNVTFQVHATFQQDSSFNEHGFFIQGVMEVPMTVRESQDITFNFVPTQAGEYAIICTVFCGTGHSDMHGLLNVLP